MNGIVDYAGQEIGPIALEEWLVVAVATTDGARRADEFSGFEADANLFGAIPDALRNEAEVFKRPSAGLTPAIALRRGASARALRRRLTVAARRSRREVERPSCD